MSSAVVDGEELLPAAERSPRDRNHLWSLKVTSFSQLAIAARAIVESASFRVRPEMEKGAMYMKRVLHADHLTDTLTGT